MVVEVLNLSVFLETVRYVLVFCMSFDLLGFLHHFPFCVELLDMMDLILVWVVQGKYHSWGLRMVL